MDIIGGSATGAGGAKGGPNGGNVIDGSDRTFMQDVIEASKSMAVVVDFWAPWCGPCRQLGPIIEKVVNDAKGAVRLVKIDIDKDPGVAGQLGVQSIPAVIAFKNGRPVDGFMGAIPESKVKEFVARIQGDDAERAPDPAELIQHAEDAMDQNLFADAEELLVAALEIDPGNVEALATLAKLYLKTGDHDQAREIAERIPEDKRKTPVAAGVFTTLELSAHVAQPDEALELLTRVRNTPGDFDARLELAKVLAAQGKHDDAADQLFAILEKNMAWNEGAAKEQLLKIFEAAGPKADVTKDGRRRLSALLFR